jgi:hypothetical protein
MLTRLKKGMNSTRGNEGACPLVRSRTTSIHLTPIPWFDKKFPRVQVENDGKTGDFPARHILFQDLKKQLVDFGG